MVLSMSPTILKFFRMSPHHSSEATSSRLKKTTHRGILPYRFIGAVMIAVLLLGVFSKSHPARAQEKPVKPPSVKEENVQIKRGRDIVQIPSVWYQEGTDEPDSLGVLRVPRKSGEPELITYPDKQYRFPVNLQVAVLLRDGQVAELPISQQVINGVVPGRIIIRPPADDFYDIAEPFGVDPIKQVPGDETIIDAREWYEAALYNPVTNERAPETVYHNTRELRGRLRSTAQGGETIHFFIPASKRPQPQVLPPAPIPPVSERIVIPEVRSSFTFRQVRVPNLDWITTTAVLGGPNRADLPGRPNYSANRVKGDVASTLRFHVDENELYEVTFFGSTNATFGSSGSGSHNDVPYGLSVAARFGERQALELRAEAGYEDDPFQAQTFGTGDERLRVLFGYDRTTPATQVGVSVGPTYFRDRPSSWEGARDDARELGFTLRAGAEKRFKPKSDHPILLTGSANWDQSWGYIRDGGNSNMAIEGRVAVKPSFFIKTTQIAVGPVAYLQYTESWYDVIDGFSEFNAQFGVEMTTRVRF